MTEEPNAFDVRAAILRVKWSPLAKNLAVLLYDLQGRFHKACTMSPAVLGTHLGGAHEHSVKRALAEISDSGALEIIDRGPGRTKWRRLLVDVVLTLAPPPAVPKRAKKWKPRAEEGGSETVTPLRPEGGNETATPGGNETATPGVTKSLPPCPEGGNETATGIREDLLLEEEVERTRARDPADVQARKGGRDVAVVDLETAQRRMVQLLVRAWETRSEDGGLGRPGYFPASEHAATRRAGAWLWDALDANAEAFEDLAPRCVRRWASEPFVLKKRVGLGDNFEKHIARLFEEERLATTGGLEVLGDGYVALRAAPGEFGSAEGSDAPFPTDHATVCAHLEAGYRGRFSQATASAWAPSEGELARARECIAGCATVAMEEARRAERDVLGWCDRLLAGVFGTRDQAMREARWPWAAIAAEPWRWFAEGTDFREPCTDYSDVQRGPIPIPSGPPRRRTAFREVAKDFSGINESLFDPRPAPATAASTVCDAVSAGERMVALLAEAWLRPREQGGLGRLLALPTSEHPEARAAGQWLWGELAGRAADFEALAPLCVEAWASDSYVQQKLTGRFGMNLRKWMPRSLATARERHEAKQLALRTADDEARRAAREAALDAQAVSAPDEVRAFLAAAKGGRRNRGRTPAARAAEQQAADVATWCAQVEPQREELRRAAERSSASPTDAAPPRGAR